MNLLNKIISTVLSGFCTVSLLNMALSSTPEDIHIAFVSDENYPMPVCVAMASIITQSTPAERLHFHIVDLGIKAIDKIRINHLKKSHGDFDLEFIHFDKRKLAKFQSYTWSPAIYAKLLLGDLLPAVDKCILIDGDVIANRNVRALYDLNIGNNYIAIINNYSFTTHYYYKWLKHVNAGVILMNLQLIRQDGLGEKSLISLKEGQINLNKIPQDGNIKKTFTEEHVFQEVCAGRIFFLPVRFNLLNYMIYTDFNGAVSSDIKQANANDPLATDLLNEIEHAVFYHYSDVPKVWFMTEEEWYQKKRSKHMRDLWYRHYHSTEYAGK